MKIDKNPDDYIYYQARYNIKKYRQKVGITSQQWSSIYKKFRITKNDSKT